MHFWQGPGLIRGMSTPTLDAHATNAKTADRDPRAALIRRLYDESEMTVRQIATAAGIGKTTVFKLLHETGPVDRAQAVTPEQVAQALAMYVGLPRTGVREIAARTGMTPVTLDTHRRRAGIEPRSRRLTPAQIAELRAAYVASPRRPVSELASAFDIGVPTLHRHLNTAANGRHRSSAPPIVARSAGCIPRER